MYMFQDFIHMIVTLRTYDCLISCFSCFCTYLKIALYLGCGTWTFEEESLGTIFTSTFCVGQNDDPKVGEYFC